MSSHPQGRLLESPTDVHSHITQKLSEDGLNPECSDLEKLLFLWKLHQHLEDDLRSSRETEAKLKEAQAEEMKEVESYVEHIRHLSDERETLIQELETENESLKAQVVNLEQGNNEAAQAEIIEMLTQQGLGEISDATQSEQIAYLLVERARLLDELEEHNNSPSNESSNVSPNADGRSSETELKQILEQERGDFEEELSQHRESAKIMKEQLKQEHEEEINALMEENSKLEEDLQRAEMQVSQLKAELSKYEEDNADAPLSGDKSSSSANDADRKKLNEERNQLNREKEDLEKEVEDLEKERSSLKAEKDKFNQEQSELEKEKSQLLKDKEMMEKIKSEVDSSQEKVDQEKKVLSKKTQDIENARANLEQEKEQFHKEKDAWEKDNKESPRTLSVRNASPSRTPNDMALRKIIEEKTKLEGELVTMRTQMRSLQKEKDSHDNEVSKLKGDLEKSLVQQKQLQIKNRSLTHELQELEMQLDETETSIDQVTKEKQDLTEKCDTLNTEMKTLRADALKSNTLQDIVDILNNDKKHLSESLESLKKEFEQTSTEKQELATQNNRLSKEEQELANQLQASKEELQKVTKEKEHLMSEKNELLTLKKKQEDVEALLRTDLEEMLKVKEKFVSQTETLSKENKDLLNKLDRTREDLEGARIKLQELAKQQVVIDHLKEQNQHLTSQMSSTQDDLGKSKDRETMLISTQQSLQKNYDDTEKRFTHEIDDLKLKLELTLQELAKTKKQVDEINLEKKTLGSTLEAKDKIIQEYTDMKRSLEEERSKKNSLQLDVNRLEVQLAEKTIIADKFERERKQRLQLESQITNLRDVEESLKVVSRELDKEKQMRKSLEAHSDDLEKTLTTRVSKEDLTSARDTVDKERQLRMDMEERVKELEYSLKEVEISSQSANERLQNEQGLRQSLETNVKDLQVALTQQGTTEELSRLREELNKERAAVKELEESKEDVQLLCGELEKERSLRAELTRKVAELEVMNSDSATSTLKATLDELDRERRARAETDISLQEMEQMLEDQRIDSDTLHHSMSAKMLSLEKRVQALQDDLFSAQDELQAFQEGYDEAVREAERVKAEALKQQGNLDPEQMIASHQAITATTVSQVQSSAMPRRGEAEGERSANAKMQETLNELNLVKSKLCSAEAELLGSRGDIDNSRKEVILLKQSLEQSTSQLERSEEELRSVRQQLFETQGSLKQTLTQLDEKQAKLDSVVQDRAEVQRELDTLYDEYQQRITPRPADPSIYGGEERQEHVDRISTLEKLSRQLELDNREMARKLSDTITKNEELEEHLQREKLKNTDRYQQSSRYTDQLEHDLDAANKHIRQLREEVQQHHTKMFKIEADSLGVTAKYESTIARLEQETKDLKHRHRQELDSLSERMETASNEARELRSQKREVDQELNMLRLELSRLKSNNERLENHLQAETKQRQEIESRNSLIDSEMAKVWSQIRSLMEKNAELETTSRNQKHELTAKKSALTQVESTLAQKEIAYDVSHKTMVARAETAEKKAKDLQKELEEVTQKMLNVERQLAHADTGKVQLEDTKDKLVTIRNQLEGEKLQRTLLDQTVAELKHQVALLKQRESKVSTENKELQHTILDLESRLTQVQDNISLGYEKHNQQMLDVGKRSLMDQITRLQREVKELQYELYNVSERRDIDVKRYEERKVRTKAKLMKARDFYTTERTKYMDHMKHMEEDLRLTQATLSKEVEWRDKIDDSYKDLIREKRELITQLSEVEENLRDKTRNLSMAQVRTKYLEEENSRQQERIQALTQQKHNLDKLLKDFGKRDRMRMMSPVDHTVGTSGLGNSLDSAWDPNDMTGSWSSHIEPPANFGRSSFTSSSNNTHMREMGDGGRVDENEADRYVNVVMCKQDGHEGSVIMPRISGGYSLYKDVNVEL